MTIDPLVLMTEVDRATERVLDTAARLDDAAAAGPSLLPGWTRGHVLTHLARNADAYTNLITWARTGVETPAYASSAARDADIAAGAGRPLSEQVADLRSAAARFAEAAAALPAEAWAMVLTPSDGGPTRPVAALPWGRLREVEVHHVDLNAGYPPDAWSTAFALRLLKEIVGGLTDRAGVDALLLRPTDVQHPFTVGDPAEAVTVAGPTATIAAWLAGRGDGKGLTVTPERPLPTPPRWM